MTNSCLDIDYQIIRSRRKTVAIMIKDGLVEVRAPKRTPQYWIDDFVQQKRQWIAKQLKEQAIKERQIYQLKDGQLITFLGAEKVVRVIAGKNTVLLSADELVISCRKAEAKNVLKVFDQWLLEQAKLLLPAKVESLSYELAVEHKLSKVIFRKTKTKWGHCTVDGVIQLNQLILLAPLFVTDYLIIHELCHLRHMNHSKDFWNMVEAHCPGYEDAERWIKEHGHKLWFKA
ncbi:MAG: M48 family metallopeptidase [Kangiellaceae bacterium]|nr:M48 family metallopeptidase [Kangiellaceae bacterium]